MLKEERQVLILNEIINNNKVRSSKLSKTLGVSEDTIRRDLKELAEHGKIKKVHGGAMASSLLPYNYKRNNLYQLKNKQMIARKALSLLKDGQVVIVDGGTTNMEFVKVFPTNIHLTVFTNSIPIANLLSEHPTVETIFLGGKLLKSAKITVGIDAVQMLSEIQADLGFIGTRSLHKKLGITTTNREEAIIKKKMADSSSRIISLVLSEKLGTFQPFKVIKTINIDTFITELSPTDPIVTSLSIHGGNVL